MDGSGPREGGVMKPVYLRVCVALVLSATGLIMSRFESWKEDNEVNSCAINQESSSSPSRNNDGEEEEEEKESLVDHQNREIISLNSRLEELQRNNNEIELRFKRYCDLKDQEAMLMEQECMLVLEKSQLDFFGREVSAMAEELKRGQDFVIVYIKLVGEIQELRSKNLFLEGGAKNLRVRVKQLQRVVNQKSRKSIISEKKLLKCLHELGEKDNVVKELEGQVKDLKAELDLLQEEKEVYMKSSENSEMVSVEDNKRVLEKYEDLKTAVNYLRGINACLRKELMRNGTTYEDDAVLNENHKWGKRTKRFVEKLKRCVGGHSGKVEPDE